MRMPLNQRIAIMYQVLDICAEEMDSSGEKSCILNVVARKYAARQLFGHFSTTIFR